MLVKIASAAVTNKILKYYLKMEFNMKLLFLTIITAGEIDIKC